MSLFSYSVTVSACAGPRIEPSTVSINHNCNFLEVTQFRGCVKREWALIPNAPSSVPNLPYVSCRPKTQQCFFVFFNPFQNSRFKITLLSHQRRIKYVAKHNFYTLYVCLDLAQSWNFRQQPTAVLGVVWQAGIWRTLHVAWYSSCSTVVPPARSACGLWLFFHQPQLIKLVINGYCVVDAFWGVSRR